MSTRKKADVELEQPATGGSFLRDPATGKLTRVEHPPEGDPEPAEAEPAPPADQQQD